MGHGWLISSRRHFAQEMKNVLKEKLTQEMKKKGVGHAGMGHATHGQRRNSSEQPVVHKQLPTHIGVSQSTSYRSGIQGMDQGLVANDARYHSHSFTVESTAGANPANCHIHVTGGWEGVIIWSHGCRHIL